MFSAEIFSKNLYEATQVSGSSLLNEKKKGKKKAFFFYSLWFYLNCAVFLIHINFGGKGKENNSR